MALIDSARPARTGRPRRVPLAGRPARHLALTTGLVLLVCLVLGTVCTLSYRDSVARLHAMTGRADGQVVAVLDNGSGVRVRWQLPGGGPVTADVPVAGDAPAVGTRTQVGYVPDRPADAVLPGAALLATADADQDGVVFAGLVIVLVLGVGGWRVGRWWRAAAAEPVALRARRVRYRRGLLTRSWLEFTGPGGTRWLPVCFDPALVPLPAPVRVQARGRGRYRVVEVAGTVLYPSGWLRDTEPAGRRIDSPDRPDDQAVELAKRAGRLRRQLWVDAALLVPAPLLGVLWAFLSDDGLAGWFGATAVSAAVALWWAALRGTDPS